MTEFGRRQDQRGTKAQAFFDQLWSKGDFWNLERSKFEGAKYARQLAMLQDRRYSNVLEIGCAAGTFTHQLAGIADRVLALDISSKAIERAQAARPELDHVEFRAGNVMDYDFGSEGPWELIVMSETIYYLGWLYPFFDVGWLALQMCAATAKRGRLLMANTLSDLDDEYLLSPWLIRTYRDLFLNVGYHLEAQEVFRGKKGDVQLETLISLFVKSR